MTVDQIIGLALLAFVVGYMAADLLRGGTRGFTSSSLPSHRRPSSGMADESPRNLRTPW
jgi:hypothetical protein